jgi:hypothetical protein
VIQVKHATLHFEPFMLVVQCILKCAAGLGVMDLA